MARPGISARTFATLYLQTTRKARPLTAREQADVKELRSAPNLVDALRRLEKQPRVAPMMFSLHTTRELAGAVLEIPSYTRITPEGAKPPQQELTTRVSLELHLHGEAARNPVHNSIELRLVETFEDGVVRERYFDANDVARLLVRTGGYVTPKKLAQKFQDAIEHPERASGLSPTSLVGLTRAVKKDLAGDASLSAEEVRSNLTPLLDEFRIPARDRAEIVKHVVESVNRAAKIEREAFVELAKTGARFKLGGP